MHKEPRVFELEWQGRHLLYEPWSGQALLAGERPLEDELRTWFQNLCARMQPEIGDLINAQPLTSFKPVRVTLIPTGRCNLRCSYCYASGGEHLQDMPWWVARWAIDFVVNNAVEQEEEEFQVYFHGGGEPTVAWDLIERCLDYARERAEATRKRVQFGIATNGVFGKQVGYELARNFELVSLAFDGPEPIHNLNRKNDQGQGSFPAVLRTAHFFDENNYGGYSIVTTVTDETIIRLPETLQFFKDTIRAREIHVGPVVPAGRSILNGVSAPDYLRSIPVLKKALEVAWDLGLKMSFPGINPEVLISSYCGLGETNFYVTYQGFVSRCLEVCNRSHPFFDMFAVGELVDGQLHLSAEKLVVLSERRSPKLKQCQGCLLQWHCAGDCAARVGDKSLFKDGPTDEKRCKLKRELFGHTLGLMLTRGMADSQRQDSLERFAIRREEGGYYSTGDLVDARVEGDQYILGRFARLRGPQKNMPHPSLFSSAVATCPGG